MYFIGLAVFVAACILSYAIGRKSASGTGNPAAGGKHSGSGKIESAQSTASGISGTVAAAQSTAAGLAETVSGTGKIIAQMENILHISPGNGSNGNNRPNNGETE